MSENDPWKKVGTYVADICLDDGDLIDVDVCLRTQVDAARAAEATQHQQEIAAKNAEIDRCDNKIDALRFSATELLARLAAVEAERDRLKAALSQITALDFEKFNGRHNFYSGAVMFVKAWLLAYAALSGEGEQL